MKALMKGGLCLALGWLTTHANAQEIHWKASAPKQLSASAIAVVAPPASAPGDTGIRAVTLTAPLPLDPAAAGSAPQAAFRPIIAPPPTIRGQVADDPVPPLPTLGNKDIPQMPQPRPLPKNSASFSGPTPAPIPYSVMPVLPGNPAWDSMGIPSGVDPIGLGSDGCCSPQYSLNNGCCPNRGRFWASAEYLLWFQKPGNVPPLVTTGPVGTMGQLGLPTTTVLYDSLPDRLRSGGRFDLGMWFQSFPNLGIETSFLTLGRENDTASFSSPGVPQLFRPFQNVNPPGGGAPVPATEIVAVPGIPGTIRIDHSTQLWGIEGNFRYKLWCGQNYWVDALFGYRHLNLSESIDITENPMVAGGASFLVQDSFHTRTQFNGFQSGIQAQWFFWNNWSLNGTFKLAMGTSHEVVDISGTTTIGNAGALNGTYPGGLYALPTNIGHYTRDRFAVLPEVALKIGYNVTPNLQLFVGYDFLALSNTVRPGEQIDTRVNPAFLPPFAANTGPRYPAVLFNTSSYWAQGVTMGLKYTY